MMRGWLIFEISRAKTISRWAVQTATMARKSERYHIINYLLNRILACPYYSVIYYLNGRSNYEQILSWYNIMLFIMALPLWRSLVKCCISCCPWQTTFHNIVAVIIVLKSLFLSTRPWFTADTTAPSWRPADNWEHWHNNTTVCWLYCITLFRRYFKVTCQTALLRVSRSYTKGPVQL